MDDAQLPSQADGMGVVAAIRSPHLLVALSVLRVAFGCDGSPIGVPVPSPPYSSVRPNAL